MPYDNPLKGIQINTTGKGKVSKRALQLPASLIQPMQASEQSSSCLPAELWTRNKDQSQQVGNAVASPASNDIV